MRIRIQRPRRVSESASLIRVLSGVPLLSWENSKFVPRGNDTIINWGSTNALYSDYYYFNKPSAVRLATDKLCTSAAFEAAGVQTVESTQQGEVVTRWLSEGRKVLARDTATGCGGAGVTVLCPGDEVIPALYYSKYVPKFDEYRIHVVAGLVIDVQQKRRRRGSEVSNEVRSSENGWVFCREGIEVPDEVLEHSTRAVAALGLDYGAVDTGFTRRDNRATVYEVNTAPGLSDTTARRVIASILYHARERRE